MSELLEEPLSPEPSGEDQCAADDGKKDSLPDGGSDPSVGSGSGILRYKGASVGDDPEEKNSIP